MQVQYIPDVLLVANVVWKSDNARWFFNDFKVTIRDYGEQTMFQYKSAESHNTGHAFFVCSLYVFFVEI